MVSVEDSKLRGAGSGLKAAIWDATKSTIEQWTGMELKPTSMYGIRIYTEGMSTIRCECIVIELDNSSFARILFRRRS
jgi:hypothetical protein